MVLNSLREFMAEGAGFEPAVGFPTFDFESSALNRTQPPFRVATPNECLQAQQFLKYACDDGVARKKPKGMIAGLSDLATY